jgi:fibronectin type III domain protein
MTKKMLIRIVSCTAFFLAVVLPAAAQGPPEISFPVKFDISGPIRDVVLPPQALQRGAPPLNPIPRLGQGQQFDPVLQNTPGNATNTTPGLGFEGIAVGAPGCNCAPPDTNMAVGPLHAVQWVNTDWAVWNKTTGVMLPGYPKAGNSFWSGFGGDCETHNDGDPIIQYDRAADRWVATQFAITTPFGPYSQCFAVSTTGDPGGTYARYQFMFSSDPNDLNDYPKMGVWPVSFTGAPRGAYFMSYNMFQFGAFFAGPKACAYDRDKMLNGTAATQVCFQQATSVGSILPTDLDGPTIPASGTPGFYFDFGTNELLMWKFTPNFATPGSSSFTGPTHIPTAAFSQACGSCVPQSETTQTLDTLSDRLMYRPSYREFSDHKSVAISHSVTGSNNNVAPRWYEVRDPNGSPSVFQQGTFSPDSTYRWMPSIAQDQNGDIAVGYSASSSTMHPAIRFTGREPGDAAGTMQTETNVFSGAGSQNGGLSRWGDYSAMRIDPSDDCTFWYTTEYIPANGSFNWHTRIASFKFNSCGLPPPPPTPPNPPTGLTATAVNCSRIDLAWTDNSNNEDGFHIYRCTGDAVACGAGPFSNIATAGVNATSYSDTTVASSTSYTYQVKAFNSAGESLPSNPATASTPAPAAPNPPSNLSANAVSSSQINLSWTDNSNNEDGFKIERCTGAGCTTFAQIAQVGANVTTYSDTGRADDTTYRYRVRAFATSCGGDSAYSNEAEATTPLAAPTNLTATAGGKPSSQFVDLSWTDNSTSNTNYDIERCAGSGCTNFAPLTTVGDVTSYRDSTVARRTTYNYRVRARNAGNGDVSAYSNTASATTR